jgi:hypothetical protein
MKLFFFRFVTIFLSFILILFFLEIVCRNLIEFEMDYYAVPKKANEKNLNIHPYGVIPINKDGFFDKEFNFENNKRKIGYFGDSVTYGVGAGYPYRFTEYLNKLSPEFDHLNLSGGINISLVNWNDEINNYLINNNIKKIIYMMNLNDIAPLSYEYLKIKGERQEIQNIGYLKTLISPIDKIARGNSMLYTFVRFKIKFFFVKRGFEASGNEAIELYSYKNKNHIINASNVINQWSKSMNIIGIKTCVVILPYEMQISKIASEHYKKIGIKSEKDFENFSTQRLLKNYLNKTTYSLILEKGFLEKNIGHYFVFNKGDKIDFNHPNREGHLVIAKEISKNKVCQTE